MPNRAVLAIGADAAALLADVRGVRQALAAAGATAEMAAAIDGLLLGSATRLHRSLLRAGFDLSPLDDGR